MKKPRDTDPSRNLAGEVHLARIRLAGAESEWKSSKLQSRLAKRRRKEAKEAARRAKKQVKLAKAKALEARQALAEAEGRVFQEGRRVVKTKKPAGQAARKRPAAKTTATKRGVVRVDPSFALAMHIDTDEANAANVQTGAQEFIDGIQSEG